MTPFQLVRGGDTIDATKAQCFSFGTIVQIHEDSHENALAPRITYGLVVGRDVEYQGKIIVWSLSTRAIVHRHHDSLTVVALDDKIKGAINRMYDEHPYTPEEIVTTDRSTEDSRHLHYSDTVLEHHRSAKRGKTPKATNTTASTVPEAPSPDQPVIDTDRVSPPE